MIRAKWDYNSPDNIEKCSFSIRREVSSNVEESVQSSIRLPYVFLFLSNERPRAHRCPPVELLFNGKGWSIPHFLSKLFLRPAAAGLCRSVQVCAVLCRSTVWRCRSVNAGGGHVKALYARSTNSLPMRPVRSSKESAAGFHCYWPIQTNWSLIRSLQGAYKDLIRSLLRSL